MAAPGLKDWLQQYFVLLGCPSFYLFLLILDVYNSYHTHSYWVAPKFLSLNAFTLQIISALVDIFKAWKDPKDLVKLINLQHLVDAARLMGCISIAYIVPDVSGYSVHEAWEYLGTLFFIVLGQLIYRIYSFFGNKALMEDYKKSYPPPSGKDVSYFKYEIKWFIISNGVYLGALFFLLLVLACTLAAGKTMKALAMNKITRRISKLNSTRSQSVPPIPIQEVFYDLWLVVRASRPSNVAARSVLSSASTFIATLLVGFTVAKWSLPSHLHMFFHLEPINKAVVLVECIFSMAAWFVLLWRWFATVHYFSYDNSPYYLMKYITQSEKEVNYNRYISKLSVFYLPDRIVEQILIKTPSFVHHSLKPVFCIMKSFILVCRISSTIYASLTNLFFCMISKIFKSVKQQQHTEEDYKSHIDTLTDFTMFGESAENLWRSNLRAFKKVKTQVQKGNGNGQKLWKDIHGFCDVVDHPQLYFNKECSWKMEVIWHVTMLMCCYCVSKGDKKEAEEAIDKAITNGGSELWHILSFMEQNESKNLIADNEFRRLQRLWQKCCKKRSKANRYLEEEVKGPLEEAFGKLSSSKDDHSEWKRQEIARYFNTRCTSIDCDSGLASTMGKGTKWILGNLYHTLRHCICESMHNGVIEKCYSWASELDEDNLCNAAFEIGKAQGLIEAQGLMEPANVV